MKRSILGLVSTLAMATLLFAASAWITDEMDAGAARPAIPLKEAKLNIEHNATDNDTGFQAFVDSEGWQNLELRGPGGNLLSFQATGELGQLGLTELFFETVEPENADVSIKQLLKTLPEGNYTFSGKAIEAGENLGRTEGIAVLTHQIPAGPGLLTPAEGSVIPTTGIVASWTAVTRTIFDTDVTIIAYQLIMEKDVLPHPHMIGKFGLSMYLPPLVTSIAVPDGFLEPGTKYNWEVLAIEESGNQTLSSGTFETE